VRRDPLHEHRSSQLGIDLVRYRDGLGRFDDRVVSEAALATGEPTDSLPFEEVGDLRSDLHDQAYALHSSQVRRRNGRDARPLVDVQVVHARDGDLDEDLGRRRNWTVSFGEREYLRSAEAVHTDCKHPSGSFSLWACLW
jgi:hypothetical protein